MNKNSAIILAITVLVVIFGFQFFNWGALTIRPPRTITVSGQAESQERNQIASFYAGASAVNEDRQTAVDEVNQKVTEVTQQLKEFGIDEADIQTQNLSVFQEQEQFIEEGAQRYRPGSWRANNSLNITLRDISRTSELTELLTTSGLTDISGPNFRMENTSEAQTSLLNDAIADAREKAELIAEEQNMSVYKALSISEGATSGGVMPFMRAEGFGGGGGVPVEPGSTTVQATVTVVFEVR